jgi:hypothetical protein
VSDPSSLDPLALGGSGVAGAGIVAVLLRYVRGQDMSEIKTEMKELVSELKSDFKEQMTALRELMARNDDRHDKAISEVASLSMKVNALHQRLDTIEATHRELERRHERLQDELAR